MEENKLSKVKRLLDQLELADRYHDMISDQLEGLGENADAELGALAKSTEAHLSDLGGQLVRLGWDFNQEALLIPLNELDLWSFRPREGQEYDTVKVGVKVDPKAFAKALDHLMEQFNLKNHVTIYTPTPSGSMLSYSDISTLREAQSCIDARVAEKSLTPSNQA